MGSTYLAVNSSNVSSWLTEASSPSLSIASLELVLKLLVVLTVKAGTGTADREQRGTAWRMEWDRKKVDRAATRKSVVDDIGKVEGGRVAVLVWAIEVGIEVFGDSCERCSGVVFDWLGKIVLVSEMLFSSGYDGSDLRVSICSFHCDTMLNLYDCSYCCLFRLNDISIS